MKFSVIVPVYKVEEYLPACVDSILSQSCRDFELILVDDGSPDNCPRLCDEYARKDTRVKVIHQENGGASAARNAGIHAAMGEYLLFVDSDDFWKDDTVLTKILRVLQKSPSTIVQFGRQKFLQPENRYIDVPERMLAQYSGCSTEKVLPELVRTGRLTIAAWSMAVETAFVRQNKLYFIEGIKTEDLDWAIRLYSCKPTWSFIDEYLYIYRMQREGSVTATIDYKHLCDYCWIIENSVQILETKEKDIEPALMSYMMYHVLIICALCYRVRLPKEHRGELLARLKAVASGRICNYTLDKRVKVASVIYRIGGFSLMAKALGVYLSNR